MTASAVTESTWVRASWDNFVTLGDDPAYQRAKFYYHHGCMRVEMSPVGPSHAQDNSLIALIIGQWAFKRGLRLYSYVNVTLRKTGQQEAQPDLACFMGETGVLPARSNKPVELSIFLPPVLAVEVSATTLEDDLTTKRELYGELGVREYWVVDVKAGQVLLFGLVEGEGLQPLQGSCVLSGLSPMILSKALERGQVQGDAGVIQYIMDLEQ